MYKRFFCLLLCLLLLFALSMPGFADEGPSLSIYTVNDFLSFAESCRLDSYSENLSVSLENDLDLSGTDFQGVPIFSGSFDGKGHSITGLSITVESSAVGLFRYLTETASVKNLHISGSVAPGGSRSSVGGIAGESAGIIRDCTFDGSITGGDYVGGIVGENSLSGIIQGCSVNGRISGKHFVGGIAGESSGVIRDCENFASINTEAQENVVDIDDISTDTLLSSESANTVTDIGGITGLNSGVIRDCENFASIGYKHMGYNIGGIAGTQVGYITDCTNYGSISGRKEVGGIAGQMEPVSLIEFNADTLQILEGQLGTLEGLTERAAANAQGGAAGVGGQLGVLGGYVSDAMSAVGTLIPGENQGGDPVPEIPGMPDIPQLDNSYLPDEDTITAAQNNLSSAMSGMQSSMNSLMAGIQGTVNTLSNDMRAITDQIGVMSQTIGSAGENIGGSISDVSDDDTEEMLTGKVENCMNMGSILADLNAGGIAGAISIGNDLDHESDLSIRGENSLNFESQLRAVILRCENGGEVSAKKQSGGGIAGLMHFGLVRLCTNTGTLENSGADYVGGIAGQSYGYIRGCSAKCIISGDDYVGGIAGSGTVTTDCRSMTLLSGSERYGGILGWADDNTDEEEPVRDNYYTSLAKDPGAIDRISYEGKAKSLSVEEFLSLEGLPDIFGSIELSFQFDDGSVQTVSLMPGEALNASHIPAIPEKAGYLGHWEGLEDMDIPFDSTIALVYTPLAVTVESAQQRADGRPILLASGQLALGAHVTAHSTTSSPELVGNRTLIDSLTFRVEGAESSSVTLRYLPPEGTELTHLVLTLTNGDGTQQPADYRIDGSYLVFEADSSATVLTVERDTGTLMLYACAGAAGLSLLLLAAMLAHNVKKKKAKTAS